jgi:sialate O-acetylesterase
MHKSAPIILSIFTAIVCVSNTAHAAVRVAGIFGDHMVLQANSKLPIWGWADPNEAVKVALTAGDHQLATQSTTADATGKWRVDFDPIKPTNSPVELTITASNTLHFTDILIGEVWLCSGQSNMEFSLKSAQTGKQAIATSDHPDIRLCIISNRPAQQPMEDRQATWLVCNPQTSGKFSAVGYFFGETLHAAIKSPVGLIESAVAGTPAQSWTPLEALQSDPALKHYADSYQTAVQSPKFDAGVPSSLYNGMIAPLQPMAIKGVVWYQGESNTNNCDEYRDLFPTMIRAWRTHWNQGDFPFIFVQLPPFGKPEPATQPSDWSFMREAQTAALQLPATAMAVTVDLGGKRMILHPPNKYNFGVRLALAAQNIAYGMNVPYQGPTFDSMTVEGNKLRLHFKEATGGLVAHAAPTENPADPPPTPADQLLGFQIAGPDQKFLPATATIDGQTVVLSNDSIPSPVAARYAWEQNPKANLYNAAGLPAGTFRTDHWPQ